MPRPRLDMSEEEKRIRRNLRQLEKYHEAHKDKVRGWNRETWLKAHPEDQWLDDENQAARKRGFHNDDARQLMAAMCLKAIVDYKKASMNKRVDYTDPQIIMDECHCFFKDEIFQHFVNRMPVEEIESIIRATPEGAIHSIWKRSEYEQTPIMI